MSARLVIAVRTAIRNPQVRRAQLGWAAAMAAEWAHFVGLGVFAYERGGTTAVGIAGLVRLLPAATLAPFAAWFGDRFRRERFLAVVALVGAIALAVSAAGAFAGSEVVVIACAAFVGICITLVRPALVALWPSIARTAEELVATNGATSVVEGVGTLGGPLFASAVVAVSSPAVVFVGGAVLLAFATVLFASVRVEGRIAVVSSGQTNPWREAAGGFTAIARSRGGRLVVVLAFAQCFVRGCLNVLIVVAAFRLLHAGGGDVGYLTAAIGVGGLFGAFGAMVLTRRLAMVFGIALVFWGVPLMLIAAHPALAAALVLLAVVGAANAVEDVAGITLLQRMAPDDVLARVLGVLWGIAMGGVAIGSIVAPLVVHVLAARTSFVVVGAILPVAGFASLWWLLGIDRRVQPVPELALVDRIPMLSPLSLAAKEQVAARLVPVSVSSGDVIMQKGEVGDRFYIVGDGELKIETGELTFAARSGDYVGEIALLRDMPRTATVTAVEDSQLYALDRDDFLAAVTGHRAAHAAGEEVSQARLEEIAQARAAAP